MKSPFSSLELSKSLLPMCCLFFFEEKPVSTNSLQINSTVYIWLQSSSSMFFEERMYAWIEGFQSWEGIRPALIAYDSAKVELKMRFRLPFSALSSTSFLHIMYRLSFVDLTKTSKGTSHNRLCETLFRPT